MDVRDLELLMIKYGLVIRAIPNKIRNVVELCHSVQYPDGQVQYLEEYKRKMWVSYSVPEHAGEFIVTQARHTRSTVTWSRPRYFKSISEIKRAIKNKELEV